jgi:pyrimidine 5'-nucleotidase
MHFEVMFFDLDETLYPSRTGIWQAIGVRMDTYIIDRLGIETTNVSDFRENLFLHYGTTLRGLRVEYGIDENEFLAFVHDIPLDQYLQLDPKLADVLELFPSRKVIFTNADTNHARRVLSSLGVNGFFDQVIDIQRIHPYCKPMPEAFQLALQAAGVTHPADCVMIDDSERNLRAAHDLGMYTICVGTQEHSDFVDAAIQTIHDLPSVIPVIQSRSTGV